MRTRQKNAVILFFFLLLGFFPALSAAARPEGGGRSLFDLPREFRNSFKEKNRFRVIPVPVFDTDPAAGQKYGVMPTLLWLDEKGEMLGIAVAALTYHPQVVKWGGFGGLFLYPSAEESLQLFMELGQNYVKDYYLEYLNERLWHPRLNGGVEIEYIIDPFERFYGFGPDTTTGDETNFVSALWWVKGHGGVRLWRDLRFQIEEKWARLALRPRALLSIADTASSFAGNTEVVSFNQLNHRFSLIWDARDSNDFPKSGHYLEPHFLLAHKAFGEENFFYGYGLTAKKIMTPWSRLTTVFSLKLDQVFGDKVPFYLQPSLGGEKELRAFVLRRFAGRGRLLFDVEERITVKRWQVFDVPFDLSLDPFFSVGQVFQGWGQLALSRFQPVGGLGIRAKVEPSVVGRIDIGIGKEGVEVFTGLDYPF